MYNMKSIGYARVSTLGQTLDAQLEKLGAVGCSHVFQEKVSGAVRDRPELKSALGSLTEGDVLVVTRLDRLARSTRDLLDIVHEIENRGAKLKALADSWADTTTPTGKLILTVLGGLAEFERALIAERTAEGREQARRDGRHLGRPSKLNSYQRRTVVKMRFDGSNNAEIARVFGVSRSTISRIK
ncbi:recombinase family protein [Pseudophaeobacter sp. 1A09344]|uniref:recombinase family protein n=1 Tax=Pseudophaeobacter sp. 1A09344 TaxID=3098144 RepID=UPI0034D54A72